MSLGRQSNAQRVTIALLPFEADGVEGEIARLGDAVPEGVARIMTGVPFFEVASLTSSFQYRTDVPGIAEIGERLSVRYVVQGAVRAHGGRVRVSARLGDCRTGREVWSDTSTKSLDDPFAAEDEMVVEFALALETRLVGGAALRDFGAVSDLEWYREFNRGVEAYIRFRRGSNRLARSHYLKALEIRPDSPQTLAYLAFTHASDAHFGWSEDRNESLRQATDAAERALDVDPDSADALIVRGHIHMLTGQYDRAIEVAERGVQQVPTYGVGLHNQAMNMLYAGRFADAARLERHAIDVTPLDVLTDNSRSILATALVHLGRYVEAVDVADQCLVRNPYWLVPRVARAAALKALGRDDAAREEAQRILGVNARFSLEWWKSLNPYRDPDQLEQIVGRLREIGLPDRSGESALGPAPFPESGGGPIAGRWLATVLLSDVVNSTGMASEMGDRKWSEKIGEHDRRSAAAIESHGGRVVKTTGDGVLAIFDSPSGALLGAVAVQSALADIGLEIRSGLHTGEIELARGDVSGLGVHIAARVSHLAGANEILVTSTVKDLVFGSDVAFSPQGRTELRGVPGTWELFSLDG